MELPSEIVSIISAFSKPLLRYPKVYKQALDVYGLKEWPELMEELSFTGEPKEVLNCVRYYTLTQKNMYKIDIEYKVNRPGAGPYELVTMYLVVPE